LTAALARLELVFVPQHASLKRTRGAGDEDLGLIYVFWLTVGIRSDRADASK
jgi:hypothetical protein